MTGPVTGIRRRRGVAGRRETPHLPLDRDFYGQTLNTLSLRESDTVTLQNGQHDLLLWSEWCAGRFGHKNGLVIQD